MKKLGTVVYLAAAIAIIVAVVAGLFAVGRLQGPRAPVENPTVQFENHTQAAGLLRYAPTFALVAADVDGDRKDDLFVGNHGHPPVLFLNRPGGFEDAGEALPIPNRADRHGYTFVDLDNDGDRDFVFAGGGADGIGIGTENEVYRNQLVETGKLQFINDSHNSDIAYRDWRSRQFLPLANARGDRVDLYLTALHKRRKGTTNLYVANASSAEGIRLDVDETSSLNQPFESNGMDMFLDFDRDGDADFLRLGELRASLYRNDAGVFAHQPSALDEVRRVASAAAADFNNDGYLDLYLGGLSGHTNSDNLASNAQEIHFLVVGQPGDAEDSISFRAGPGPLAINLMEHLPELGKNRTDPTDIYLGSDKTNPARRVATITREAAAGRPADVAAPGIYLWFDADAGLWHVLWKHDPARADSSRGIIAARDIQAVEKRQFETFPPRKVTDYIVLNRQGRDWQVLELPVLQHSEWTNDVTAADFNNDGFIDIAGVRSRDDAEENGSPFVLLNRGNLTFVRQDIMGNSEDDIFRADCIVHGFFNADGLPDLFYTNGNGLLPSHIGPYQYWLNSSASANGYLLVELEGSTANRDAIGAQVELYGAGDRLLGYRELGPGYGRSQDTHTLHYGLGSEQGPFRLRIRWPGSDAAQEVDVQRNSSVHIRQAP